MRLSKRTIKMLKDVGKKYEFKVIGTNMPNISPIRTTQDKLDAVCPICAIANDKLGMFVFETVAYQAVDHANLNIPFHEIEQIMDAADHEDHPYRCYLMKHLGMN